METNQIPKPSYTSTPPDPSTPVTPQPFVPEGDVSVNSSEYLDEGWSWGGFSLNWLFLVAVRKYVYLFALPLMLVPILNIFLIFGMAIFMGMNGREFARTSRTFSNHEQYLGFMKGVDHAGKVVAILYLLIIAGSIILVAFLRGF